MSYAQFVTQRRLRRISESPAAFQWITGQPSSMPGMTFTRASTALYQDAAGVYQSAAVNTLRTGHYINGVNYTLREGAGTNSALGACSFADGTYWVAVNTPTLAAGTSCISGQTATKHTGNGAAAPKREQTIGVFVNAQTDCYSVIAESGTSTTVALAIRDVTAGADLASAILTFATGVVTTGGTPAGSGAINLGTGPNGGVLWRLWLAGTGTGAGTGAAGNARRMDIYPQGVATAALTDYIHHAQFEAATSVPSSPIVTVAAGVTRAADLWSFAWTRNPEAGTWYADIVDLMGAATGLTPTIFMVSNSASATAYTRPYKIGGKYRYDISMAAGISDSAAAAGASYGDRVELRPILTVSGSNVTSTLGQSINGAAEAVAAAGPARAIDAAWSSTTRLYIGALGGGTQPANFALRSLIYVPVANYSLANFRTLAAG